VDFRTFSGENSPPMLLDRDRELAQISALLDRAREGESGSLVVTGVAGVGKTSLIEGALEQAAGVQVRRVVGIQAEAELDYGALHRLLRPHAAMLSRLPAPQRAALEVVFGLSSGAVPDPFLVGLATLTAISDLASAAPLICVFDDAQWLDQESRTALAFVARRLLAEGVLMLLAVREGSARLPELDRLPTLRLGGIDDRAALTFLAGIADIDRRVASHIIRAADGNPLALGVFAGQLSADQRAGHASLPEPMAFGGANDSLFSGQILDLSAVGRDMLLVAAADPSGDPDLVWRASEALGILEGVDPAQLQTELTPLLQLTPAVQFRHPLVRSTAYGIATHHRRREAHAVLAEVTDPAADPDRQTWHLAAAASGPDEAVAQRLDESALRARRRGGYNAEMALLTRAVELTPEPGDRCRRRLAAAEAALLASQYDRAGHLLAGAAEEVGDNVVMQTTLQRLRTTRLLVTGNADVVPALMEVARGLKTISPQAARDAWATALHAAFLFDGSETSPLVREIAAEANALGPGTEGELTGLLLDAVTALVVNGRPAARESLRRALESPLIDRLPPAGAGAQAIMVTRIASDQWDPDAGLRVLERIAARDRQVGALDDLAIDLLCMHALEARRGHLDEADGLYERAQAAMDAAGSPAAWSLENIETDALRGRSETVFAVADRLRNAARIRGGQAAGIDYTLTVLHTARSDHREAVATGRRLIEQDYFPWASMAYSFFVESAARSGDLETARWATGRLAVRAEASGTPWAVGILAVCRSLVDEGDRADALLLDAIGCFVGADVPLDLGRAHLLRGELQRRTGQRQLAAESLRTAYEILSGIGAGGFAERARIELRAVGARPRRRNPERRDVLTAQEGQIARAAAAGATNREIAAQMFLSEATVAYHLQKVFRKLGLSSRRDLSRRLGRGPLETG
jgi:DNA-binding CsgD family transcriptional regulator